MAFTRSLASRVRHARGWSTPEKIIGLNVDDYGNVRLANAKARDLLAKRIDGFGGYMDHVDALETREDLEALFDVLSAVRDCRNRPAVLTAYALCANPDFTRMRAERRYACEPLPATFARCAAEQPEAYEGAWDLWREGVDRGVFRPQFHGREHVNVPLVEAKLAQGDADLEVNLQVESMAGLHGLPTMPGIGFTQAFGGEDQSHLDGYRDILRDGLARFEAVFGFRSLTFTPPAQKLHPSLKELLRPAGILTLDRPFVERGRGGVLNRVPRVNFPRPPSKTRVGTIVRTVSFEPGQGTYSDPVGHALRQIEHAFDGRKPAVVSSHRVNFAGHIDPANRKKGLHALQELLQRVVQTWPDVQFITADELAFKMRGPRPNP